MLATNSRRRTIRIEDLGQVASNRADDFVLAGISRCSVDRRELVVIVERALFLGDRSEVSGRRDSEQMAQAALPSFG